MIDENLKYERNVDEMIRKLNSGWERLFPENPELEDVFMK